MRNIHLFETVSAFTESYEGEGYLEPWVSYTRENTHVDYNKHDPYDANGHKYVDLGLPSGTLWATMNVGASSPTEYGGYFAWGETTDKYGAGTSAYTWNNYAYGSAYNQLTKYCPTDKTGYWAGTGAPDNLLELVPGDDAARANWGGDWHMPTSAQCQELLDNTTTAWTNDYNGSGVAGMVFTSNFNGNSIFFPAAGDVWDGGREGVGGYFSIWTSSLYADYPDYAWYFSGDSNVAYLDGYDRCRGQSVRGVLGVSNEGGNEQDQDPSE